MTFIENDHTRADIGTFATHGHTAPEPSAELRAENRIPLIGDWAQYTEEWDVSNVRPGGPDAPVEYVIFYAGPYTGQVMPTQDDGDPLPAGRAPTQNYLDARDEAARTAAEAAAEAQAALPAEPEVLTPVDYLRRLVNAGMAEPVARTTTCAVIALDMNKQVLAASKTALDRGQETSAAMLLLAHSAVEGLPNKVLDAGADLDAADAVFLATKRRIRDVGQMFDMMSSSGREPAFVTVEAMVDEAREMLTVAL